MDLPVAEFTETRGGVNVKVILGGEVPSTKVPGGAVAGTRVSPDTDAFIAYLSQTDITFDSVADLGSGCGLLGSYVAAKCKAKVVLTDVDEMMPCLQRTIDANPDLPLAAQPYLFGDDVSALKCDVLIGAGIAYWQCVYEPLKKTMTQHCERGGTVYLGYFKRDWGTEKRFWTKCIKSLQTEVVWEGIIGSENRNAATHAPVCTTDAVKDGDWNARVYKITAKA
eukprot:GEMP01068527.1.p1 GENE.GEMP01068527.1~~GEMP01068527.1.p1  ORF type:complete len:224 (+),score=53.19 GEMP01068527.1:17-688(+)